MAKPKLAETYRQFENVDRFMKRAQALDKAQVKPSTRRLRAVFGRLFEENELRKIIYQKVMATPGADKENIFNMISPREGALMLRGSVCNAHCGAKIMVERLEKAAEEYGYSVDLVNTTKEEVRKLPGLNEFLEDCVIRRLVPVKAVSGNGRESRPLIFSPNLILVQREGGAVEFPYYPYDNNFAYFLNGLAFM